MDIVKLYFYLRDRITGCALRSRDNASIAACIVHDKQATRVNAIQAEE